MSDDASVVEHDDACMVELENIHKQVLACVCALNAHIANVCALRKMIARPLLAEEIFGRSAMRRIKILDDPPVEGTNVGAHETIIELIEWCLRAMPLYLYRMGRHIRMEAQAAYRKARLMRKLAIKHGFR